MGLNYSVTNMYNNFTAYSISVHNQWLLMVMIVSASSDVSKLSSCLGVASRKMMATANTGKLQTISDTDISIVAAIKFCIFWCVRI